MFYEGWTGRGRRSAAALVDWKFATGYLTALVIIGVGPATVSGLLTTTLRGAAGGHLQHKGEDPSGSTLGENKASFADYSSKNKSGGSSITLMYWRDQLHQVYLG